MDNKQIGWSQESYLLHQILKQLERLAGIIAGLSGKVSTLPVTFSVIDTAVNPGTIAVGGQYVSAEKTVAGAAMGDLVSVSFSNSLQGCDISGYVSSPGKVTYVIRNGTAVPAILGAGNVRILVTHF